LRIFAVIIVTFHVSSTNYYPVVSRFIMAVLYVSREKAIMFYRCTLFFSKGNLQSFHFIHTFTQYPVLV